MSNQEVEGEERPSIRCVRSFWASLNALHPDRDGYSARPQQQRLHAGSDNRRLPLSVCTSTRKIRVSDIHSTTLSGSRRPSGMPWIFHRWMICFLRTSFFSYSLGDCVVSVSSDVSILASIPQDCSFQLCIGCTDYLSSISRHMILSIFPGTTPDVFRHPSWSRLLCKCVCLCVSV